MGAVEKFVNRSGILEDENIVQQIFDEIKEELTLDPELGKEFSDWWYWSLFGAQVVAVNVYDSYDGDLHFTVYKCEKDDHGFWTTNTDEALGRADVKGEDVGALFGEVVEKCVKGEYVDEDDLLFM